MKKLIPLLALALLIAGCKSVSEKQVECWKEVILLCGSGNVRFYGADYSDNVWEIV